MNAGDLKAVLAFPADEQMPCTVQGSLSNFSMPELNQMLVPVYHTEIESGEVQKMKFQFQYDEYRSVGDVELSYTNLRVKHLKKNPQNSVNKLVSFVLNIFVQKDLDKSDTKEKRTGSLQMERDPQRGVLSYWWQSIASGIKSVFHGQSQKK